MDNFCNSKISDPEEKQVYIGEMFKRKLNIISDVCDYHGLYNQGATCYLNSVLQVLFMTNDFKEAIESQVFEQEQQQEPELENKDGVGPQLKKLFEILKTSNAGTEDISSKLGIGNVFEQQDAAQYLEKILSLVNADVSKIFKGQLRHISTCSEGHPIIDKSRPFWSLPLSMKDSSGFDKTYSVDDGWTEFFKSSTVSGDNKMYCDGCDEKADATIEYQMKDYPEILTLLLKRFQFDYNRMDYVKIDCCVEVPYTLQTARYAYELYAIVDHVGSLRGGHYTSRIKSYEDQKWYVFDDSYVRLLNQQPSTQGFEISRRAYLLMYKKLHAPDLQMNHGTSQGCSFTNSQCQSFPASGEGDVAEKRKEDVVGEGGFVSAVAEKKGGDHGFVNNAEKREQGSVTETGEDNAKKREQGSVTETGEDNAEKREQGSVTETGEDNVKKREQGGVTETGEDNAKKREQGGVTETGEDNEEKREQGVMKETGEDNIKKGGVEREGEGYVEQARREDHNEPSQSTQSPSSVNTSGSRQTDLTLKRKGEDNVEKREQGSVIETGEDNAEKREQGSVTETGEDNAKKREQGSVTETGEDNAEKREQGSVTETGEDNVKKREQGGVTETGEDNVKKREQGGVTETGEDNAEKREQGSVTETGEDNAKKREQGGVTETGEDNEEKREQGVMKETGEGNIKKGGVEREGEGYVEQARREDHNEPSQSTQSPSSVNTSGSRQTDLTLKRKGEEKQNECDDEKEEKIGREQKESSGEVKKKKKKNNRRGRFNRSSLFI